VASLSNLPTQPAILVLAARKSFSFTVQFRNSNDLPLELSNSQVSFTIGEQTYSDHPILTKQADTIIGASGTALFNLQASQLNLEPGIYPFEIVLKTVGYSSVAVNGELEVEPSYEMGSLSESYDVAPSTFGLIAHLKHNRLIVTSNAMVLEGAKGDKGDTGKSGMPWGEVAVEYNDDNRIKTLVIDGVTTTYVYNLDGTIAYDERDGIQRTYTYEDGLVVSIEPEGI
jgi:hypothetical protein